MQFPLMLAPALLAGFYFDADGFRLAQIFSSWRHAEATTTTLRIEFTQKVLENVFQSTQIRDGIFKLRKSKDGKIQARLELKDRASNHVESEVLRDGQNAYYLKRQEKVVLKFAVQKEPVPIEPSWLSSLVQRFVSSLVLEPPWSLFTGKECPGQAYQVDLIKEDEWYTYLEVNPRGHNPRGSFWFFPDFQRGRLVVQRKATAEIPRDMPRELWFMEPSGNECKIDFLKVQINPAGGVTDKDFELPDNWPGWKVETVPAARQR